MNFLKHFLSCIIIMTLALVQKSHAQDTSIETPQDYVDAHNAARAAVGVGGLIWDPELENIARQYAYDRRTACELVPTTGPYGENLARWDGPYRTGTAVVQMWVDQKADYDYASNTCADGKLCGSYTQVVWANSISVGCAQFGCLSGWTIATCVYDPPGNVDGEWPY